MKTMIKTLTFLIPLLAAVSAIVPAAAQTGDAARGEYVLNMAGCVACHTVAKDGGISGRGPRTEDRFRLVLYPQHHARSRDGNR